MANVDSFFPNGCEDLWIELDYRVQELHAQWILYRDLFGTTQARWDILNETAGSSFVTFEVILMDHVQLALCKLGDPAGKAPRTNLTLAALVEALRHAGEVPAVAKIAPLSAAFDVACASIRERRNKRIGHFDRETLLRARRGEIELMNPSRAEVETALTALRVFMHAAAQQYGELPVSYENFVWHTGGTKLLEVLRRGLRYAELVETGAIAHDDLRSGRPL